MRSLELALRLLLDPDDGMCELWLELTLRTGTDFEPELELEDFVPEDWIRLEVGEDLELPDETLEAEVLEKALELEYLL